MSFGKGYVVLLEVLLLAVCSYADPVEEWITFSSFEGNVFDMVVDANGNVYLTGDELYYDYATVKYDTNGNEQWVETYDGGFYGEDRAKALVMDSQGNIYVTGSSESANGDHNIVTIKYSNDGVRQWVRRHDINVNSDYPIGICIDSSDNIYVAGTTLFYEYYIRNTIITIKYNDHGDTQWINEYDYGDGNNRFYDIASDSYGNVYMTGESSAGFATVKYDTNGEEKWTSFTEEGWIPCCGIALDSLGNVYVSGRGNGDYITVKIDSAGTEQWVEQYDYDGNNDYPQAIVADGMGNVFITGYGFEDIGYDIWAVYLTVMYNSDGNMVWQRNHTYYGMDWSKAYDLCLDEESNVYVTGSDYSPYDNGWGYTTIKYSIAGGQEWIIHTDDTGAPTNIALDAQNNVYVTGEALNEPLWATVKYNQQLGISEGNVSLQLSPVYPNPNCGSFNIYFSTPTSTLANIRIYDITGKLVSSVSRREYSSGSHELQFDGIVPGIYICRIDSESASVSRSFVVID